nr:hypothetical protein [Tanacetum cinerariifolium]
VDAAVTAAVVEDVAKDVAHVATPSPPPHGIPSPPQEPFLPPQQPHRLEIVKLKARVKKLEKTDKIKSSKLRRLRKVGASRQVESSDDMEDVFNQGRMMNEDEWIKLVKDAEIAEFEGRQADKQVEIYNIDLDHSSKVLSMQEDDSEVQEVVEVMTTAKLITEVVTAAASHVSAASTTIPAASATIPAAKPTISVAAPTVVAAYTRRRKGVIFRDPEEELSLKTFETPAETPKVKDKGKGIMVEASKPMKKKDQIEMDAEYARKLQEEIDRDHDRFNKDVDWDAAMDHVNQKYSSNPQYIKRYKGIKKRPQTESEARKNMMIYLKNIAGYKMDFFKGMTYAQICPIFQARFDENISDSPILGVNTHKSDEDRLKLIELMVFLLQKGVYGKIGITAARLSSYCCQANFWNSVSVKRSGDVTRLQALVDKKKIVISEAVIHEILQLNDAEGVICLPNEEIFAGLAQMGYEKPSTKLTFYKAFFSSQWMFLIHTILQSLMAKRTSWNEFSTAMASAVICLSKAQVGDLSTHTIRFISPALTQKVFANMKRVEKGFSWVETPLFESMIADRQPAEEELGAEQVQVNAVIAAAVIEDVVEDVAEDVAHVATPSPPPHGIPPPPQEPFSPPQQPHVTPSAPTQISATSITIPAASATIPAANPTISAAAPTVVAAYTRRRKGVIIRDPEEELSLKTSKTPVETLKVKDKGKGIMVEAPKPMKKKDQIEMDAEYARKLQEEIDRDHDIFNKDVDWDAVMDHVNQKSSSNPQYIKRYQGMKKRPQRERESEARKNMMIYLKNTAGYKMDFFKGMTYAQICPIFQARFDENIRFLFKSREEMEADDQEIIKSINETHAQKTAKRRKLSKEAQEAEDLRKRLEVVEDEDDDVFVEATPLASKVPVMDYQIVLIDSKPRFKIIRADETHQLYISFATLLKNFDREDLETLWRIVKDRFSTSKPTNFSDKYLLLTPKTMFEEPDGQDAI